MTPRTFAEQLDRDAAIFVGGPATGFGEAVKNGTTWTTGVVSDRYVTVEENGFQTQRRVKVLRLAAGAGGTIAIGTDLELGGVTYRVDDIIPVEPDRRHTDYVLAGGAA